MPYADINGIRFNYSVSGKGDPVVLIAGFGSNIGFWRRATEILSPEFSVIAVDNRGIGLTEYGGPFTMDDMGDDVVALLGHLGHKSAHILGWSMGSHVAQNIAIRHPDAVRTLTLVSSYLTRPARTAYMFHSAMDAVDNGMSSEYLGHLMNGLGYSESFFRNRENINKPPRAATFEGMSGLRDQFRAIDGHDTTDTAHLIKAPTLLVHGTDDIMVRHQETDALCQLIAGSKCIKLEGVGHLVPSDDYIPQVAQFIRDYA